MLERPRPPANLITMDGLTEPDRFVPAPEITSWIKAAYLAESGPLYFEGHEHLNDAEIGCLWTTCENVMHLRRIVGEAEMPSRSLARHKKWLRARSEQQLIEWFGDVPDFLLTFDAVHADQADDATFAALVAHELLHCAQAKDATGAPKFYKSTGKPMFRIRAHDVSEFIEVVRQFGIEAAGEEAVDFVLAAAEPPLFGRAQISAACGTCIKAAA